MAAKGLTGLLVSSAAILTAARMASGEDLLFIEPEPIDYVRICDVFGAGYIFIPGTESCVRLNGQVRSDWATRHYHKELDDETSAHEARYRARLEISTKNLTEYGEMESRIQLTADGASDQETGEGGGHDDMVSFAEGPGDANVEVDRATISLAGFYLGFDDDYWKRAGHSGWYVSNSRFEGPYGNYDGLFIEYTYRVHGFAATIGLEDGNISGEAGAPDPYFGVTYTAGGLYLAAIAYYDNSQQAGAYKGRFDYDFGQVWSDLKIGGWYGWDDGKTDYAKGHGFGLTAQVDLSDSLILFGGYGAYDNQSATARSSCSGDDCGVNLDNSGEQWKIGLQWQPIANLFILPEYQVTSYRQEYPSQQSYSIFNMRVLRAF